MRTGGLASGVITCLFFVGCSGADAQETYDIVIENGRVMDPETNFDAVRNVGIKDGVIVTISEDALDGARVIDATGHVVAPGFIDTHVHGADPFTMKMHVRDGVTSIMDTEYGSLQITKYYDAHKGVSIINYGTTVSHEYARIAVMDGVIGTESTFVYTVREEAEKANGSTWVTQKATPEQILEMKRWIDRGLAEGAIGGATTVGYFKTAATTRELLEIQKTVAEWGRLMGAHPRMGPHDEPPTEYPLGFKEVMANALSLSQPLIASHINFTGWQETQELLVGLRKHGHIIWGEQYPWVSGGPSAGAAITSPREPQILGFRDPRCGAGSEHRQVPHRGRIRNNAKRGPRAPTSSCSRARKNGCRNWRRHPTWPSSVTAWPHLTKDGGFRPKNYPEYSGVLPYDAAYEDFKGHPRCAGSRGKVLRMAREHDIPLMLVINNASYFPAKMLGLAGVKFFDKRGRMQEGMIADITIFDPGYREGKRRLHAGHQRAANDRYPLRIGERFRRGRRFHRQYHQLPGVAHTLRT